jgi:E3 ubiquitin-protein ligase synoviolin
MSTLFLILWTTDLLMFLIAVENTMANGVGGMVLFASEVSHMNCTSSTHVYIVVRSLQYAILMASVVNTISKYLLSAYELRRAGQRGGENAPPWDNKSMWVFYIELATGNVPFLLALLNGPNSHHEISRFFEINDIPRFLHHHHYILRFAP